MPLRDEVRMNFFDGSLSDRGSVIAIDIHLAASRYLDLIPDFS